MASKDPAERILISRIAALELHARHIEDPAAHTAPARAGLIAKFEREVDPDGALTPAERTRRANLALKAHLGRIRLLSHQARRVKAAARRLDASVRQVDAAAGAA